MKLPIFKYYDPFNDVESKTSDQYSSLAYFFMCFEKSKKAGNNPQLMMATGRNDKDGEPIFSGDIVRVALSTTTGSAYHGTDETREGHRIGVVRYQPSKGFVISRAIEAWDDDIGALGEYTKSVGAFEFSSCNAKIVGNINSDSEFYESLVAAIKRRGGQ